MQTAETKCSSPVRCHHLLKTFWGWRDRQLRDGTVIWTSPEGDTYVTTPGSALLFPSLCAPTGELTVPDVVVDDRCGQRTAMMPTRRRTRAQNWAHRIAAERRQNQRAREARRQRWEDAYFGNLPHVGDDGRRLYNGYSAQPRRRGSMAGRGRVGRGPRGTLTGIHMVTSLGFGRNSQATKGNR